MTTVPICFKCGHFTGGLRFSCKAFPGGIPDAILTNLADHREPYPGDGGTRFEPTPIPTEAAGAPEPKGAG